MSHITTIWELNADEWIRVAGQGRSKRTIDNVVSALRVFLAIIGDKEEYPIINDATLSTYRHFILNRPLSPETKRLHLNVIRRFLIWCQQQHYDVPAKVAEMLRAVRQDLKASNAAYEHDPSVRSRIGRRPQITGRNIIALMDHTGLNAGVFAAFIGVAPSAISHYQRHAGRIHVNYRTKWRLMELLQLNELDLFVKVGLFLLGHDNNYEGDVTFF